MLELSDTQKLMLVASCAGLVTATILVTVCVVTPHCWLYHCIWGKDDEQERRKKLYYGTDVIPLPACPVTTKTLSASSEKSVPSSMSSTPPWTPSMFSLPFVRSRQARDSTYSSMSTASSRGETSIYGDSSGDVVSSRDLGSQDEDLVFGNLAVSLRFQPHSSLPTGHNVGYPAGKLIVNIREAQNLPPRAYGGVCDPYALVRVFKGRLKKRRSSSRKSSSISGHCISQCQTQVKRKTQCPLFNEAFSVDLVRGELKECSLHVALFDLDKYSNDTQIGEVLVSLKELQLVEKQEEHLLQLDLKEPRQHNGEILFGLSYLPTAERLTFSIMKASNLISPLNNLESFFPCVRVLLFHNGKLKKKKKTAPRQGTLCPVYNESLTFDVPQSELDKVVFLLVVSHRDPSLGGSLSSPDSPTTPVAGTPQQHVGKVVVGSTSRGSVLHHWNAMKQSPRKQVTQWHTLR